MRDVDPNDSSSDLDDAGRFIVRVGTDAHRYGASAPRVANYLSRVTHALGLRGGALVWPHHMLFIVTDRDRRRQRVDVEQVPGSDVALARLAGVGEVVGSVERGDLSPHDALHALDEIEDAPPPWSQAMVGLSYAVIGVGLSVLLRGTWYDVALAALLAVTVYAMVLGFARLGARWTAWVPLITAFVPAAVASAVRHWQPEVNVLIVTIAAVAILIPGYAVSVGIGELVEDHVIAGLTNLARGIVYLAKQVIGAWLGVSVVESIADPPVAPAISAASDAWLWLFMPLLIVGLCIVFQTARQDFAWATISCLVAYTVSSLADRWNADLGTLVAAAVVAVYANVWASRTKRPTSIVLLPAVVLLVSGSVGFQGLAAIAEGETNVGVQQFVEMFVVAVMLTAGLLIGNTIVRPRNTL